MNKNTRAITRTEFLQQIVYSAVPVLFFIFGLIISIKLFVLFATLHLFLRLSIALVVLFMFATPFIKILLDDKYLCRLPKAYTPLWFVGHVFLYITEIVIIVYLVRNLPLLLIFLLLAIEFENVHYQQHRQQLESYASQKILSEGGR